MSIWRSKTLSANPPKPGPKPAPTPTDFVGWGPTQYLLASIYNSLASQAKKYTPYPVPGGQGAVEEYRPRRVRDMTNVFARFGG